MNPVTKAETYAITSETKDAGATAHLLLDQQRAGMLFTFGGIIFLLLTTVAEAIYPNFSLQTNAISDLAAVGTRTTVIEGIAILGVGVCWLAGAYYLFRRTEKRRTMVLWMLPAVGLLMAGGSPENVNLVIHSTGAPLAFILGAVVAISSYRKIGTAFRYFAVSLGSISLVSTFVIFLGQQIVGPCGNCVGQTGYVQKLNELGLGLGGWESMIIYPLMIWMIGFGNYLLGSSGLEREWQ